MSAIANPAAKVIWLVEHYADSTCLLGSILKKWHYQTVRILDSEVLAGKIGNKSHLLSGLFHSKNVQNALETILTFSFCLSHIVKPCISI